jgi:hypothetical protein
LLNYSFINLYILLVILNIIDELVKSGKINKYLNFNKDLYQIIEYRNTSSIFSLYIQNVFKNAKNNNKISYKVGKIKKFAFMIDLYFYNMFNGITIDSFTNHYSLYKHVFYKLRPNSYNNFITLFDPFYIRLNILLNDFIIVLSKIEYIKSKNENKVLFIKDNFIYEILKI